MSVAHTKTSPLGKPVKDMAGVAHIEKDPIHKASGAKATGSHSMKGGSAHLRAQHPEHHMAHKQGRPQDM